MEFKEIGNQYNKEVSSTERYLLRIIKRYFDLEELNNAASINAIIIEAMARYKASINYGVAPVLSINNKVGIVNLNIHDLKGEMLFEKLTAFNKNFGTAAGTICAGDNLRLSDRREPNEHHHKIPDIIGLKEELEDMIGEVILYSNHLHVNMVLLNKIQYTGTRTQIDLIELETIGSRIITLINILDTENAKLSERIKEEYNKIIDLLKEINLFILRLQKYIDDYDILLEEELKKHIDDRLEQSLIAIKENLETYANKEAANELIDTLNSSKFLVAEQEIDMATLLGLVNPGESLESVYTNSSVYGQSNGTLNIYTDTTATTKDSLFGYDTTTKSIYTKTNADEYQILLSANKYRNYTHEVTLSSDEVDDDCISIILAVNTDINLYTLSLCIQTGGLPAQHGFAVIVNYLNGIETELAYDNTFSVLNGWSNNLNGIRVKIERTENIIKIYRSEMNTPDTISSTPCITIDLKNSLFTEPFLSPCMIGYGAYSQNKARFSNLSFNSINELILVDNIYKEQIIDTSVLSSEYIADTMEIEPEFTYGNTEHFFPYITKKFCIECGKNSDNKVFVRICPFPPFKRIESSVLWRANGKLYFIVLDPMTWQQAKEHCENLGGHLAVAIDETEMQTLKDVAATSNIANESLWIGGTDEGEEGTWKWVTGETFYKNGATVDGYCSDWGTGEPNNAGELENCLQLVHSGDTFYWNDLSGDVLLRSIGVVDDWHGADIPIEFINSKLKYKIYAKKKTIPYLT